MSDHEPAPLVEQIAAVLGGAFTYPIKAHDGRVIGTGKGYLPAWEAEGLASQLARLVEREKYQAWWEGYNAESYDPNPYARD